MNPPATRCCAGFNAAAFAILAEDPVETQGTSVVSCQGDFVRGAASRRTTEADTQTLAQLGRTADGLTSEGGGQVSIPCVVV